MKQMTKILALTFCMLILSKSVIAQTFTDGDRVRTFGSIVKLEINDEVGTGFLINQTGIIVTNAHVVENLDPENPAVIVSIFESTIADPEPYFLARPLERGGEAMIYDDIDIAVLQVYADLEGTPIEEGMISLSFLNYWGTEVAEADPINLFGYPNLGGELPVSMSGIITRILPERNYASDVIFGDAGSGGPAINDENKIIGVARARATGPEGDYTVVISLGVICEQYPGVCDLLPEQPEEPTEGPPARRVEPGGFLQCLNARGPSFQIGDTFVVPNSGSGGTFLRRTPSWVINNRSILMEEGDTGRILQGPVCGPAAKGELIGWFIETEDGETGWASEGYIFNVSPWITRPELINAWSDIVPEDFDCPDSYGPNLKLGDRFIVPVGDGETRLWVNPNRGPEGDLMPEGTEGSTIEGPVCARGNGGLLVSWRVLTDSGLSGWASEGYDDSPAPWIAPIVEFDDSGVQIEPHMVLPTPPPSDCLITATTNASLRGGPGTTFDKLGTLTGGTSDYAIAQATGTDGLIWWQFSGGGWVRSDLVTASEACVDLPIANS